MITCRPYGTTLLNGTAVGRTYSNEGRKSLEKKRNSQKFREERHRRLFAAATLPIKNAIGRPCSNKGYKAPEKKSEIIKSSVRNGTED